MKNMHLPQALAFDLDALIWDHPNLSVSVKPKLLIVNMGEAITITIITICILLFRQSIQFSENLTTIYPYC